MKNKLKRNHFNNTLSQQKKELKKFSKTLKDIVPNKNFQKTNVKRLIKNDGSNIT